MVKFLKIKTIICILFGHKCDIDHTFCWRCGYVSWGPQFKAIEEIHKNK